MNNLLQFLQAHQAAVVATCTAIVHFSHLAWPRLGPVTNTLPASAVGLDFCFCNYQGQTFAIAPNSGDQINYADNTLGSSGVLLSTHQWDAVDLKCVASGVWVVMSKTGTNWTLNGTRLP